MPSLPWPGDRPATVAMRRFVAGSPLTLGDWAWGGTDPPAVVFRYAPGGGKAHAAALLAGYRGILQCDGYAAYKALTLGGDATLAFCWSHVRRGFYDLAQGGAAPIAVEALQRIGELYAIEVDTVERAIRPIYLSRKNALFASGDEGGARWTAIASLVETCKMNGVDPQRYFAGLFTRLVNGWPNNRIDELMPWCWATTQTPTSPKNP